MTQPPRPRTPEAERAASSTGVKLTNLEHDSEPVETHITDGAGRATFSAPRTGDWLLTVIWTEVAPPSSDADFETRFRV